MGNQKFNKVERVERNATISTGLRAWCPKDSIPVNGKRIKAVDLAKAFDAASEAEKKVITARAVYLKAVEEAKLADETIKPMIQPIKGYVMNTFGERSDAAASFGFSPRKSTKTTVEVRAEAAVKLRATRAARGTMGSRQKASVHGHVESPLPQAQPIVQPASAPAVTNGTNGATQSALLSLNGSAH
jgi:hypothetical protein